MIVLCETWSLYVHALNDVRERGPIVPGVSRGVPTQVKNPSAQIARDCLGQLMQLWSKFGLTPADRSRFDVAVQEEEKDPMLALLTKPTT